VHCNEGDAYTQKATPVYRRARPVPYASLPTVEQELDRLLNLGVITPARYADWAARDGCQNALWISPALCGLLYGLNDALQLHQDPLPVPDDIFATLNGGHASSRIDFSDAYLQVELDDDPKRLCNTNKLFTNTSACHLALSQHRVFSSQSWKNASRSAKRNCLSGRHCSGESQ
jgi:hypothetical protein